MNDNAPASPSGPDGAGRSGTPSLAWLAQRYRPALIRYFVRHLGMRDDAEDLAQEALERLARKSPDVDIANVEAYLFRIASNLLRDRFRRDSSHHVHDHVSFDGLADSEPGEEPSSERVYEDRERLQAFVQALDALPPRCRQVFLLQRYEGLTYSAIAKRLQISVSAVEKHMMRALLHFDRSLGEP